MDLLMRSCNGLILYTFDILIGYVCSNIGKYLELQCAAYWGQDLELLSEVAQFRRCSDIINNGRG
jgi:hypothetical protein